MDLFPFSQDMKEKREGLVTLPDTSRTAMRVFFRPLCVGHVDPSDWKHARGEDDGSAVKVFSFLEECPGIKLQPYHILVVAMQPRTL